MVVSLPAAAEEAEDAAFWSPQPAMMPAAARTAADTRMAFGIEVHKILRIVRAIVAADHIKIEIALNLADIFVAVHKITRAK